MAVGSTSALTAPSDPAGAVAAVGDSGGARGAAHEHASAGPSRSIRDDRRGGLPARSGPAAVQLVACSHGRPAGDRWAVFRGVMRQVPEGERMRMRFGVEQRIGREPYERVQAPGLGVWHEARPGVERFAYRQRVVALTRGGVYRALVHFRWYDADGERIAVAGRRSRPCRQRGRLANLATRGPVSVYPGPSPASARYVARVVNSGDAPARAVEALLVVDGVEVDSRALRFLRPGARRRVRLLGPACTREAEVRLDPRDAIVELSERDNERSVICPSTVR